MNFRKNLNSILMAAAFLLAAFSAYSQAVRPTFDRPRTYDVQHYLIRVSFDRAKKSIAGDTTVKLKPLTDGLSEVELDAVGLAFSSVSDESAAKTFKFRTMPGKVIVTLDRKYAASETIAIRFKYTAKPSKGIYFKPAGEGHSEQIFTQGEPDYARHWIPSFDFPSDRATTEEFITANKGETVIGNGELVEKIANADETETWHYKMPLPHSTYLISFIVGRYVRIDDTYGGVPLGFYTYSGREVTARKAFGDTKKMMAAFEELTGVKFPFNKYDQTVVSGFDLGGMENITATTLQDQYVFLADLDFGNGLVVDLVSHELSHSWFGDLVTCNNWAELWLNEGFATYMEAAYREKAYGRELYIAKVRSDAAEFFIGQATQKRHYGLYNRTAADVDSLFKDSSVTYNKGGAVLHMLREQIGTEAFWKGVNIYLNRHKLANVETTDLKKAMEESSGQDLTWFFDQWVYGVGAPKLTVRPVYNARTKTVTVTFTQTQRAAALVPMAFRMPMNIAITTAEGTKTTAIDLKKRLEVISLPFDSIPTEISIDPEEKVVLKEMNQLPISSIR